MSGSKHNNWMVPYDGGGGRNRGKPQKLRRKKKRGGGSPALLKVFGKVLAPIMATQQQLIAALFQQNQRSVPMFPPYQPPPQALPAPPPPRRHGWFMWLFPSFKSLFDFVISAAAWGVFVVAIGIVWWNWPSKDGPPPPPPPVQTPVVDRDVQALKETRARAMNIQARITALGPRWTHGPLSVDLARFDGWISDLERGASPAHREHIRSECTVYNHRLNRACAIVQSVELQSQGRPFRR